MLRVSDYNLTDKSLLSPNGKPLSYLVWQPESTSIVIGNGSSPEGEVQTANITADNVPVLRRESGGCAVVLTPDMLCVSIAQFGSLDENTIGYFRRFNAAVVAAIESLAVQSVNQAGTSDIAIGDRKIAGTAIYRNRTVVFYHAVINVSADVAIFDRYLTMPPRMPDYRNGRSHTEFVTSLHAAGYSISINQLKSALQTELERLTQSTQTDPVHSTA